MAAPSDDVKKELGFPLKKRPSLFWQAIVLSFLCAFVGFGFTMGAVYANYLVGVWFGI